MDRNLDRRSFIKVGGAAAAGMGLLGGNPTAWAAASAKGCPNAEKIGWRLGCQAYSFNRFTFYEAVDKNASLGLRWIEAYPGQKLSAEKPDLKLNESLPADAREEVKKKLADCGVKLVNYGVCGLSKDENASRKVFDFAKDMGIETIVSEPAEDAFETLNRLVEEYKINVALHNHPEPSHYWNPDTVLKAVEGRSRRIGACADTGHWMRSGIHPIDAIKKLKGRIVSFHLKDLNKFGKRDAHDVPWGTGAADLEKVLAEVYRQKIKAVFSIEYEHNWLNSVPEIALCVEFFDKTAARLSQSDR